MPKFNIGKSRTARGRGPLVTNPVPTTLTHEGGPGYLRDAKGELFILGVANMVGEDTFYETAGQRDARFATLTRTVAVEDVQWLTRFVRWLRTGANMRSAPLVAAAEAVHAAGALLVVDNTFATPYLQRPLELGADVVVHSTTKYLGGHSDVIGGFAGTNDPTIAERLRFLQKSLGAVPGPFDSWLVLRGIKTLALRMRQHCQNAIEVAAVLERHSRVQQVFYPGLPSHPGHTIAARQMRDFGGMVSFLAESPEEAEAIVARTKLFQLAESLGGVESLIEHPARMTHASSADAPFASPPGLVRLSVGIEAADDLLADLEAALVRPAAAVGG